MALAVGVCQCKENYRTNPNEGEKEKLKQFLLKIFHSGFN